MSKHIIVKPYEYQKALLVDQVDIDGKNNALTWGGLELGSVFLYIKKSAEVIVPRVTSEDCLYHTFYGLTTWEGLNLILEEIRIGAEK